MFNRRTNVALAGKDGNMVSGFLAINYITCYPSVKYKKGAWLTIGRQITRYIY